MSFDMERKSTEDSRLFHQAHHRALETKLVGFELFGAIKRRDPNRRAEDRAEGRERSRDDKAIPAFHSPATRILHMDRHDRRAAFLSEKNHALADLIDGAAWTVRRESHIAVRGEPI